MKKLIAILSLAAILFGFAACKKDDASANYPTNLSAEEIASLEAEKAIVDDMDKLEEEIGDSVKGKKIVGKEADDFTTEYFVVYFDNKGKSEYLIKYVYYNKAEHYKTAVDIGDKGTAKFISSDDDLRMVVYKIEAKDGGYTGFTYDQILKDFEAKGREIVGDVGQ